MKEKNEIIVDSISLKKYALASFLGILIFTITYKYSLNELAKNINDLIEHTWTAENIYLTTFGDMWLERPYIFWHLCVKACIKFLNIPVNDASAYTCAGFALFNYFVTFFVIDKTVYKKLGKSYGIMSALAATLLSFVMPIYMYWFNLDQYLGQFAINPLFNPTQMAVKGFGLLSFAIAVDLIQKYKGKDCIYFTGIKTKRNLYILFGVVLFLSTITKPTFMFMLLPAGIIFLIIDLIRALKKKDESWKVVWNFTWKIACATIPSLLYLLLEYTAFYFWGGTDEGTTIAIYPFLTAWKMYSPNVFKSWLLSMAFPIWMVATDMKYYIRNNEARLALIGYLVGTLEFCFIVETGHKLSHLNFCWPMQSGMLLIWVLATARLVQITNIEKNSIKNLIVVIVGWILLSLQFFHGLYYINPYMYII
jgi:hypothetical protein